VKEERGKVGDPEGEERVKAGSEPYKRRLREVELRRRRSKRCIQSKNYTEKG